MRHTCALLVAFSLIYSVSSGDPAWDSPSISAKQGQTILTHCLLKGVEPLRIVRLYRTVGDTEYPISDNGQLKPAYAATHRYSVTFEYANMIASITLVITGIIGDDSGTIGCYKLGSSQKSILTIDVDVPFADLYILARHPDGSEYAVEGRQTVTLTADHYNVLSCVALVNGSTAAISMTLTIGGKNEISLFESTSDSHVADMHNGFIARSSFHKLLYASTDPPGRFNGKTLVCTATKTEDGAHSMSVEVDLNVYYKPTVTCSQAQYVTALGKPLKIECEVSSNPGSTIEWLDAETRAVIQSDNSVHIDEQTVNAERVRVTLSVDVVNNKQPLKYVLKATNDVGVRQLPISIYVDGLSPTTAAVVPSTATPPPTVHVHRGNNLESGQPQAAAASNDAATLRGTVAVVSSFFVTTFFLLIAPWRC